ncbi:cytochrome b/b6 domain-containing protein [bacterium]|nr:cytochrome b/b6 domain-containing protein [bacterium]
MNRLIEKLKNIKFLKSERVIFYSIILGIAGFIAILPFLFEPRGGYGMGGIIFYFMWILEIIVVVLIYLVYEFKHLPSPEEINYRSQKKISIVYLMYSILVFFYYLAFIIIRYVLSKDRGELIEDISEFILLTPVMILIIFNIIYCVTAHKLKPISRKLLIISTIIIIIVTPYILSQVSNDIRRLKNFKNNVVFEKALETNDLALCLTAKSESFCKLNLSKKYNDAEICMGLNDNEDTRYSPLYKCLSAIAVNTKNEEVCMIMDGLLINKHSSNKCISGIKLVLLREETAGLTDEEITTMALTENNIKLCSGIRHGDHSHDCQLEVAKINDISYCLKINKFNGQKYFKSCYEYFGFPDYPKSTREYGLFWENEVNGTYQSYYHDFYFNYPLGTTLTEKIRPFLRLALSKESDINNSRCTDGCEEVKIFAEKAYDKNTSYGSYSWSLNVYEKLSSIEEGEIIQIDNEKLEHQGIVMVDNEPAIKYLATEVYEGSPYIGLVIVRESSSYLLTYKAGEGNRLTYYDFLNILSSFEIQ